MLFDKIYYINLDRRPDRKTHVETVTKQLNLSAERIAATDGSKLDLDAIPKNIITEDGIKDAKNKNQKVYVPLTAGGIGCAMSHHTIWKKIVDENVASALILEDDIRFDPLFHHKLELYKKSWPKTYDVVFLGYHPSTFKHLQNISPNHSNNHNDEKHTSDIFARPNKAYGLFGYIVSKKGAEKLLKIFPITLQIDSEMLHNKNGINAYAVKPSFRVIFSDPSETSEEFGTDIQVRETFGMDMKNSTEHNFIYSLTLVLLIILLVAAIVMVINIITDSTVMRYC